MKKYNIERLIVATILLATFGAGLIVGCNRHHEPVIEEKLLTDWDYLELAIIKTESNFDPLALGSTNDLGIFQITPIYVAEVNRLLGEDRYTHEDALNPEKALEMFRIYQGVKNPNKDIDLAIALHNPKGKATYARKVKRNIALIKTYEEYRTLITR